MSEIAVVIALAVALLAGAHKAQISIVRDCAKNGESSMWMVGTIECNVKKVEK